MTARKIKQSLIQYQQGALPNIALVATIRGGSTLISDMIAAQRGIWFFDEPFAYRNRDWPEKQISLSQELMGPDRRFFDLNRSERMEVIQYLDYLNCGAVRTEGTSRNTYFPLVANRACLKILRGSWLTNLFSVQGMQVVFSIRHPAAQALSVMRLKWPAAASIYYQRPEFLAKYLSCEQLEYGEKVLICGSDFQKYVLSWVLDVIYPLKYAKQISCQIFYEHLLTHPVKTIQRLSETCQLADTEVMEEILHKPSGSFSHSTPDTNQAILTGNSQALLGKWCNKIDDQDKRLGQEVLDRFDIHCYNMYNTLPLVPEARYL